MGKPTVCHLTNWWKHAGHLQVAVVVQNIQSGVENFSPDLPLSADRVSRAAIQGRRMRAILQRRTADNRQPSHELKKQRGGDIEGCPACEARADRARGHLLLGRGGKTDAARLQ